MNTLNDGQSKGDAAVYYGCSLCEMRSFEAAHITGFN